MQWHVWYYVHSPYFRVLKFHRFMFASRSGMFRLHGSAVQHDRALSLL